MTDSVHLSRPRPLDVNDPDAHPDGLPTGWENQPRATINHPDTVPDMGGVAEKNSRLREGFVTPRAE